MTLVGIFVVEVLVYVVYVALLSWVLLSLYEGRMEDSFPDRTLIQQLHSSGNDTQRHPTRPHAMESKASRDKTFALSLAAFQVLLLVAFAVLFETHQRPEQSVVDDNIELLPKEAVNELNRARQVYPMFMDVHVMIFVGFGFLMTYLRRYSLSAVSFNLLMAVVAIQWGMVAVTLAHQIKSGETSRAVISVDSLVNGDFAAGAVLISFGGVLGKTTPTQLVWMTMIEVLFYAINECILTSQIKALDAGGSMVIHTFGAFFGLAVSFMLGAPGKREQTHNGSRYTSDIFSMIGTLFLWMFWPSFNGALVPAEDFRQERAIVNTVLSISGSCVTAFVCSILMNPHKKFDMVHIQNATLAGGVAMGACCELMIAPASAISVGLIAGIISVSGYAIILPSLEERIGLSDTAGILNLHGMPGVLGGLASVVAAWSVPSDKYDNKLYERSSGSQGGYQLLALVVTLGIALASGLVTGKWLRSSAFHRQVKKFEDDEWFHLSDDVLLPASITTELQGMNLVHTPCQVSSPLSEIAFTSAV